MAIYRVRAVFTGVSGSPWVATHYLNESGGTAANAAGNVGNLWEDLDALMAPAVTWATEADVDLLDQATGQVIGTTITTPSAGQGTATGALEPIATQMLIQWRTGVFVGGREVRGRTFIPGLTATSNNNGVPAVAAQTTVNNAIATYLAAATIDPVIWSRPSAPGAGDGGSNSIISGLAWNKFAVLRSRRD